MLTAAQKTRVSLAIMGFLMIAAALWARLLWLQVLHPDHWVSIARRQHVQVLELQAVRGAILDRNLRPLAVSLRLSSVFADPRHVKDPASAACQLAPLLGRPAEKIRQQLSRRDRGFVWLSRRIPNQTAARVRELRIPAVYLMMESQRFYPNGHLASHVIGFAGMDTQGLEGMELVCDRLLHGDPGWRWLSRDARRRLVGAWDTATVRPRDGLDVVLNLDRSIQFFAERALEQGIREYRAKGGSVIVMDPVTGEVLALAIRPSYDPNLFWKVQPDQRRNRALTDTFEPGSVFKVVTAAVALGLKAVRPEDRFDCEQGEYTVAGRVLHDYRPHGVLTFREVIIHSSNIGVAKVAMRLGAAPIYNGMKAFGVGDRTGIDLPGEAPGMAKHPSQWSRPSITTIPMGHEVSVNAVQLAQIISTVANGGVLIRPWVIREVRDAAGQVISRFQPKPVRRVITREVAGQLKEILAAVVTEGTGKAAQVPGFLAGGKTGTAEKIEPDGSYSKSRNVSSFVGFVPVENPRLAIAVVVDEPGYPFTGGAVAAPIFRKIATDALAYLGTLPRLVTAAIGHPVPHEERY